MAAESDIAEQLFQEGHALMREQRYAEACPKFAESELHDPASGTLLALAYCQELAGSIASARAHYVAAAALAKTEQQIERERAATERAEVLAARVSTLTIAVPASLAAVASLRITSNGVELPRADWGKPLPLDGGSYAISATANGRSPWTTQATLANERDAVVVNVPDLSVPSVAPSPLPSTAALALTLPTSEPSEPRYWTTSRALGWGAIGAGAISGGLSIYFAVATKSAQKDVGDALRADENQSLTGAASPWDSTGYPREKDGKRDAALAQGFGIASGALLLGGAALVIFGSGKTEHAPSNLSMAVVPGLARLNYARAF
ncbi:MAG TPA: hypothetical protein VHV51_12410 [Polyangiaceae bacterium]|jgi:hypothetical protein|nr:hypothetical protein [Polyangiaceae bacterium]